MSLDSHLAQYRSRVEAALDRCLPAADREPTRLHEAQRYAVLGGGKRIRPVLVYAAGEALGVDRSRLDGPAMAVELIHAYSLIHDDLPAMDDDNLRRGRPTCHKAFDEATAILAGDSLQALAFHVLAADEDISDQPRQRLRMIRILTEASGSNGMAGGQAIDLASVGKVLSLNELETMHRYKTGALIRASVHLGALAKDTTDVSILDHLDRYAHCIGLAFQVQDDILDIEGRTETIGKPQGSDRALAKPTYPELLGLEGAKDTAARLITEALRSLDGLGSAADTLRWIADYIVSRDR